MAADPFLALNFDRGLVQVTHLRGQAALPGMPVSQQLDPAESLSAPEFERLVGARGLAAVIEDALRPQISDRSLLLPGAFRGALESARRTLREAAARNPAQSRLLARAERVLDEDLALRDLVQMYRSVLHQG